MTGTHDTVPDSITRFFWNIDRSVLDWEEHRISIIRQVLAVGNVNAIRVIYERYGKEAIRDVLLEWNARGIDPRRLRFLEVIFELPRNVVSEWIARERDSVWGRRLEE